jgi:hypothetical protein
MSWRQFDWGVHDSGALLCLLWLGNYAALLLQHKCSMPQLERPDGMAPKLLN